MKNVYINQNLSRIERQKAYDLRCKRRALRSKSRGNAVSVAGTSDNLVLQSPSHGISDQGSSFVPASNTVDIESIQVQPIRVITNSTRRTFQHFNLSMCSLQIQLNFHVCRNQMWFRLQVCLILLCQSLYRLNLLFRVSLSSGQIIR